MQRVAIVGVGGMGNVHGRAYREMLNAQPVAVVDIRPEVAESTAKNLDCEWFTDFDKMMAKIDPDVVDVCTPTPWHKEYVVRAAQAGKNIVVEKPMGRTLEDCREMVEAAASAGGTLMVAHVLRFFPEFATAKAQVDAGAVGNPSIVRTTRAGTYPRAWNDWFGNLDWSGGAILDLIVHDFDWLRWTFGDVERVYAKGLFNRGIEHTDYALVTLRFKSGVIAHVDTSWLNPTGFVVQFEIAGDDGLIEYSNQMSTPLTIAQIKSTDEKPGVVIPESPTMQNPYFQELEHFIDCIEKGKKPSITPEDGLRAVEIGLAAIESIKTGKPVDLPMSI